MPNNKELRVGLAMGGGVSLGTFSGAALTETLKSLIIQARDPETGERYRRVVVDVFSGSSAGALTLAIMLRGLVSRTPQQHEAALREVKTDAFLAPYGAKVSELSAEQFDALAAVHQLQKDQKEIWSNEINLDVLTAGATTAERNANGALLARKALENIARSRIFFQGSLGLGLCRVLADRVLYACTVTNLVSVMNDKRETNPALSMLSGLAMNDAMRNYDSKELRVFDIRFSNSASSLEAAKTSPGRWLAHYGGATAEIGTSSMPRKAWNITSLDAWKQITATAMASGAFPGAFAPVVLRRFKHEFGDYWPAEIAHKESHPFTYVDGGALANEPIKECFRLASYMDGAADLKTFDRLVVFIDPTVTSSRTDFQVASNSVIRLDGLKVLFPKEALFRVADTMGDVVGALYASHTKEADKLTHTIAKMQSRDKLRSILALATMSENPRIDLSRIPAAVRIQLPIFNPATGAVTSGGARPAATVKPVDGMFVQLADFCKGKIDSSLRNEMIPVAASFESELNRVIGEHPNMFGDLVGGVPAFVAAIASQRQAARGAVTVLRPAQITNPERWLQILTFLAIDLELGLEGKNPRAMIMGIGPIARDSAGKFTRHVTLPGEALHGFGGFMSRMANEFTFRVGKQIANQYVCDGRFGKFVSQQFRDKVNAVQVATSIEGNERKTFEQEVMAGVGKLSAHVTNLVRDVLAGMNIPVSGIPFIEPQVREYIRAKLNDEIIPEGVSSAIRDQVNPIAGEPAELWIDVANVDDQFRRQGESFGLPMFAHGGRNFLLFKTMLLRDGTWDTSGRMDSTGAIGRDAKGVFIEFLTGYGRMGSEDGSQRATANDSMKIYLPTDPALLKAAAIAPHLRFVCKPTGSKGEVSASGWTLEPMLVPLAEAV